MSTVQAFNTMMKNFLEELADVFPEETQIKMFLDGFDSLTGLNARAPMDMFIDSLTPHADLAMAKNPELFGKLQFPGGIDFARLWASDITDNTREAIWQYVNLLFLLGTTVRSMPAEMLQGIETVAQNCASQIEDGQLDFSALGGMLMNGGLGSLAASLGGGGGGSGARRPQARRKVPGRRPPPK
jgi:hypothetical protein